MCVCLCEPVSLCVCAPVSLCACVCASVCVSTIRAPEPYRERVATTPFTPMERFVFTAMAARGAFQKFLEVAANTCSAIEMQQNKPFATHF